MSRFAYVKYDDDIAEVQAMFKGAFEKVEERIELELPNGRGKSLALTKLEECYMWIGKALRDKQIDRGGNKEELKERG